MFVSLSEGKSPQRYLDWDAARHVWWPNFLDSPLKRALGSNMARWSTKPGRAWKTGKRETCFWQKHRVCNYYVNNCQYWKHISSWSMLKYPRVPCSNLHLHQDTLLTVDTTAAAKTPKPTLYINRPLVEIPISEIAGTITPSSGCKWSWTNILDHSLTIMYM